jgi:hypothetical protein
MRALDAWTIASGMLISSSVWFLFNLLLEWIGSEEMEGVAAAIGIVVPLTYLVLMLPPVRGWLGF